MKGFFQKAMDEVKLAFGAPGEFDAEASTESGAAALPHWDAVPAIRDALHKRVCGIDADRYPDALAYAMERWGSGLPPAGMRACILGPSPGYGWERSLLRSGRTERVHVLWWGDDAPATPPEDIAASVALERVAENDVLPGGPYHLVAACRALHRASKLESMADRILASLDARGLLVCWEYVGPNRLQLDDEQLGLANALLALLPERMRREADGSPRRTLARPDLGWMMQSAPLEAVRSEDIPAVLRERFKVLESVPLGGAVLAPLLTGLTDGLENDGETRTVLQAMITLETELMIARLLPSDYLFMVARRPV